jgi:hypothetical protein
MTDQEKLEALEKEVAALKNAIKPPPRDMEREMAEWRGEMHRISEARASADALSHFHRDQLCDMERACPTSVVRDIVRRGGIPEPSLAGQDGQVTAVHRSPGLPGSGWVAPRSLGPPPGIEHVDRIVAAQDARDRAELIAQEARVAAVRKALAEAK